jgi:amino acid transporter
MMGLAIVEVVLVVFYLIAITTMVGFHPSWTSLSPSNLWAPTAGATFVLCITACVGFEHTNFYVEEAKNSQKTVRLAIVFSLAAMLLLYTGGGWVLGSAITPATEGPDLFLNAATNVLGKAALTGGLIMLSTSLLAAGLAFHNVIARGLYSLGRDKVLPAVLGRVAANGVPRAASIMQTVIGLTVILLAGYFHWEPQAQLFYYGGVGGGLGILVLYLVTSIAVPAFFARDRRGESAWKRWIAPGIAFVFLAYATYQAIITLPTLFGLTSWSGPALFVAVGYPAVGVAGVLLALWLKARRPNIYQGIGLGVSGHTARPTAQPAVSV